LALKRHEYNRKSKHDHYISDNDDEPRHMRPPQTVVDAGDDEEQDRYRAQDCSDELLALLLLGSRRQSPLHKRGVVL
jgi:hypothetical protein